MSNAILAITDGTFRYSLITRPWQLESWIPQDPPLKGGGIRRGSPLSDGTRLVDYSYANTIDTFMLKVMHGEQDGAIRNLQDMKRLLEKGRRYWVDDWATEPVWIEARGSDETNIRYAVVKNWSLPQGSNPYAQPFFPQQQEAVMEGLALTLEHGFWQADEPGTDTAIEISAQQDYFIETIFEPTQSADDADTDSGAGGSISLAGTALRFGIAVGNDLDAGIRFRGVTPSQGATIHAAYVELICAVAGAVAPCDTRIYGEDNSTPALFTTYANFHGRARTAAFVDWNAIPAWILGTAYQTPDITTIVQEIVDRADWAAMNDMVIFIEEHGSGVAANRNAASWDNVVYDAPKLVILWSDDPASLRGRSATTTREVYIANKHNIAQVTNAYHWTAGAGPFGGNLIGAGLPFDIFNGGAGGPANGDITYFGINTALADSGPFNNLVFDILTAATYGAGDSTAWEYWNGAWVALAVFDNTMMLGPPPDGSASFQITGVNSIHWEPPTDWATVAVNAVTGYWVRVVVTEATAVTRTQQQNRDIYSCVWPRFDVDELQPPGDLPALLRVKILGAAADASGGGTLRIGPNRVILGLRSLSRGTDFSPYINLSPEQNPLAIGAAVLAANTTVITDTRAPSGRAWQYDVAGVTALTEEARISITGSRAVQWFGNYHWYLRYRATAGTGTEVHLELRIHASGSVFTTERFSLDSNNEYQILDMGRQPLPPFPLLAATDRPEMTIRFWMETIAAGAHTVTLYDLILMPVDEWFGLFEQNVDANLFAGRALEPHSELDIDAVRFPKQLGTFLRNTTGVGAIEENYVTYTAGSPILQANADQRLWFFFGQSDPVTNVVRWSPTYHAARVQASITARYQSMRGAR